MSIPLKLSEVKNNPEFRGLSDEDILSLSDDESPIINDLYDEQSIVGDLGASLGKGVGAGIKSAGWLTGSQGLEESGREIEQAWSDKQSQPLKRSLLEVEKADGALNTAGALLSNPSAFADMIVSSTPQMIGGMGIAKLGMTGIANVVKNKAIESAIAAGVTSEAELMNIGELAAQKSLEKGAAYYGGMGTGMATEGLQSAGSTGSDVEQFYKERGASDNDAKDAANEAALKSGLLTTATSAITAPFETKLLAGGGSKEFAKNTGKEALQEGIQGTGEDYAGYEQKSEIDPTQKFDFGKSFTMNSLLGAGMGAPLAGINALQPERDPESPLGSRIDDIERPEVRRPEVTDITEAESLGDAVSAMDDYVNTPTEKSVDPDYYEGKGVLDQNIRPFLEEADKIIKGFSANQEKQGEIDAAKYVLDNVRNNNGDPDHIKQLEDEYNVLAGQNVQDIVQSPETLQQVDDARTPQGYDLTQAGQPEDGQQDIVSRSAGNEADIVNDSGSEWLADQPSAIPETSEIQTSDTLDASQLGESLPERGNLDEQSTARPNSTEFNQDDTLKEKSGENARTDQPNANINVAGAVSDGQGLSSETQRIIDQVGQSIEDDGATESGSPGAVGADIGNTQSEVDGTEINAGSVTQGGDSEQRIDEGESGTQGNAIPADQASDTSKITKKLSDRYKFDPYVESAIKKEVLGIKPTESEIQAKNKYVTSNGSNYDVASKRMVRYKKELRSLLKSKGEAIFSESADGFFKSYKQAQLIIDNMAKKGLINADEYEPSGGENKWIIARKSTLAEVNASAPIDLPDAKKKFNIKDKSYALSSGYQEVDLKLDESLPQDNKTTQESVLSQKEDSALPVQEATQTPKTTEKVMEEVDSTQVDDSKIANEQDKQSQDDETNENDPSGEVNEDTQIPSESISPNANTKTSEYSRQEVPEQAIQANTNTSSSDFKQNAASQEKNKVSDDKKVEENQPSEDTGNGVNSGVDDNYNKAISGQISLFDYGKSIGLSEDEMDSVIGQSKTIEKTAYESKIEELSRAINEQKDAIKKPSNQAASAQKIYRDRVSKYNNYLDTVRAAAREFENPFSSKVAASRSYVTLPDSLHKRFAKAFDSIPTGDAAKKERYKLSAKATAEQYKQIAQSKGNKDDSNSKEDVSLPEQEASTPTGKTKPNSSNETAKIFKSLTTKSSFDTVTPEQVQEFTKDKQLAKRIAFVQNNIADILSFTDNDNTSIPFGVGFTKEDTNPKGKIEINC